MVLPTRNLAAVLEGAYGGRYIIKDIPIPVPQEHEALIHILYSGVCHGDIYARDGGGPAPAQPIRPLTGGHEGIGKVVSVGSAQDSIHAGDTVAVAWRASACKSCDACTAGAENHCNLQDITGLHHQGTFQQYLCFPLDQLIRIPEQYRVPETCPLLCAGVTALVGLRKMQPRPGSWCVIVGAAGGLGHLAMQYAKLMFGLRVVAIDGGLPEKEEFCMRQGADVFVDYVKEGDGLSQAVLEKTGGGAHYALILTPRQEVYDAAANYMRYSGQIVAVGVGNCSMPMRQMLRNDLTLKSTQTGTNSDILDTIISSVDEGVKCETEIIGLSDINDALDRIKTGAVLGKVVIKIDEM